MDMKELWKKNREYISSDTLDAAAIAAQFVNSETRDHLVIGTVDLPSGQLCVGDPLAYMCVGEASPAMEKTVEPGSYPVELSFVRTAFDSVRICTSRVKLSDKPAVRYELAMADPETAAFKSSDGCFAAFPVDAGMMAFADRRTVESYISWCRKWHSENPEGNHYDDYFAVLFAESCERLPAYQREGGDFIEWTVPGEGGRIVMNASGFGDGLYQAFWGYDSEGELCELAVPLIDPADMEEQNLKYLEIWDGVEPCIVTKHINEGGKIAYMCRYETANEESYNGWIFYGFDEDNAYWDDPENFVLYSTHGLADRVPGIIPLLHSPVGTAFFADENGEFVLDEGE